MGAFSVVYVEYLLTDRSGLLCGPNTPKGALGLSRLDLE